MSNWDFTSKNGKLILIADDATGRTIAEGLSVKDAMTICNAVNYFDRLFALAKSRADEGDPVAGKLVRDILNGEND